MKHRIVRRPHFRTSLAAFALLLCAVRCCTVPAITKIIHYTGCDFAISLCDTTQNFDCRCIEENYYLATICSPYTTNIRTYIHVHTGVSGCDLWTCDWDWDCLLSLLSACRLLFVRVWKKGTIFRFPFDKKMCFGFGF